MPLPTPGAARRGGRPRRTVTGRALVLGAVVILLLVLLASPLQRYFASRGALSSAATQYQQDKSELAKLKQQLALWSDPGFIQQQARQRLEYAMPGDTVYVVVNRGQKNDIVTTNGDYGKTAQQAWTTKLWGSVQRADASK
jgi:cell division protein FtsB